jgi:hypothetical protein
MCEPIPAKWIPLLGALVLPAIAQAADFPSQLWGRSVTVSWTGNRGNEPAAATFNAQLSVYVSSAGRTFSRMTTIGARSTRSDGASVEPTTSTVVSPYFKNGALLVDTRVVADAIHVAITFDVAYATCKASVVAGGGEGTLGFASDIRASSCSILDGNVFVGR